MEDCANIVAKSNGKEEKVEEVRKEEKAEKKEEAKETKKEEAEEVKRTVKEEEKKLGFFEKLAYTKIDQQKFDDLFWDLEMVMLENNVSVKVIDKIKKDLREELVDKPLKRGKIEELITETLRQSLLDILNVGKIILNFERKPLVICFLGVNGSGKTTTIAKFAYMLKKKGKSVVMAAADTFRAAAIDQLEEHGNKLDVKVIKHNYGADPAAVANAGELAGLIRPALYTGGKDK